MERVLRSVLQVGGHPEVDDAYQNWVRLKEYSLEFPSTEDRAIFEYLDTFYGQMSAPPDFSLVREFFEKKDEIEVTARLEEVKKAQFYIRTNFVAIVRAEREQQQIKNLVLTCRDASAIAEHGRNLDKPVDGKKVLRGVQDALGFLFDRMSSLTTFETGEKLEGVVSDDADEFLDEYDVISKTNKYAGRNLFGMEPVDSVCEGHRSGEFWVHCAHPGELKCVPGDATLFDHRTRSRRTFKEMFESRSLPIVTAVYREGLENKLVPAQASHLVQNGVRPVFVLTTASGRKAAATSNHPFLTDSGWKELVDIRPGDFVAVPRKTRVSDPDTGFTDAEVAVTGYMLGDGYLGKRLTFTASNVEIRKDFMRCLHEMGMREGVAADGVPNFMEELPKNRAPGVRMSRAKGGGRFSVSPAQELFECLGVLGKVAATKRIPDQFFGLPEEQICVLLAALWSTDGSIHVGDHERSDRESSDRRNDVKYYSTSEGLCLDVQSILLRIGVSSTVTRTEIEYEGAPYEVFVTRVVGSKSKRAFLTRVRIVGKSKAQDQALLRLRDWDDDRYPTSMVPDGASAVMPGGFRKYASTLKCRKTVSGHVLKAFAGDERVRRMLDGDLVWDEVRSVVYRGDEMTYDLSVPEHASFVMDDVVSHNTTLALNYAYNNTYVYGKNIFYNILEMPYKQLRRQLFVLHSSNGKFVTDWYEKDRKAGVAEPYLGLDYRKVRDGRLTDTDLSRLKKVAQDYKATSKGKLFIWKPPDQVSIPDIHRKAEMFHNKFGCDGIVIDYLGMVKPRYRTSDALDRINSVVTDARMLALNFARGKGTPVLSLFQINRQGKLRADKSEGRYDFAAIAYANQIEKDADVITYTYLNDQLRKDGKFYLGCMKNRDNPIFDRMIGKILWQTKRMRAIETGLLDMNNDRLLSGQERMKTLLSVGDMII